MSSAANEPLPVPSRTPMVLSAADFGAYIAAESEKWGKVVKFASIKAE